MKKTVITFFVFFLFFSGKPEEIQVIRTIDSVQEFKLKIDGLNQSIDSLNRIYDEKDI